MSIEYLAGTFVELGAAFPTDSIVFRHVSTPFVMVAQIACRFEAIEVEHAGQMVRLVLNDSRHISIRCNSHWLRILILTIQESQNITLLKMRGRVRQLPEKEENESHFGKMRITRLGVVPSNGR